MKTSTLRGQSAVMGLILFLWIGLGLGAFFNVIQVGTNGNLEASYSFAFILTLAAIKMVEVLRSEVRRLTSNSEFSGLPPS